MLRIALRMRFGVIRPMRRRGPRPEEPAKRASRRTAPAWSFGVAIALALCHPAHAGSIVDRIKSSGVIRCGGVPRPGLVNRSADGAPSGLYLDLCRAIGAALLGPEGRMEFHPYDSDKALARVADGADDLFFLDGSDIADHRLAGAVTLGPAVYFVSTAAMVHGPAPIQQLSDLAAKSICFYQGDNAHLNLEASMATRRLDFVRMGYMEYGELHDAYNSGVCDAQVGESENLAAARLGEHSASASRILIEPLATFPVLAATPASDPQWSAIVAWSIYALQRAELPSTPWAAAGLKSLGVEGRDLGLPNDWATRVVGAAGSYADMYTRNLGEGSPLKLPRGPNAPAELGGLFVTPFRE
jgi:general L-amino acid transport system substrate-binding protein